MVVTYDPNDSAFDSTRDVVITIKTTGPNGVSTTEDISFTQAGSQGITVVTDPANVTSLTASAGGIDVDVDLLGSATHWAAEITTRGGFSEFEWGDWCRGDGCFEDTLW